MLTPRFHPIHAHMKIPTSACTSWSHCHKPVLDRNRAGHGGCLDIEDVRRLDAWRPPHSTGMLLLLRFLPALLEPLCGSQRFPRPRKASAAYYMGRQRLDGNGCIHEATQLASPPQLHRLPLPTISLTYSPRSSLSKVCSGVKSQGVCSSMPRLRVDSRRRRRTSSLSPHCHRQLTMAPPCGRPGESAS